MQITEISHQLYGLDNQHLIQRGNIALTAETWQAFERMASAAAQAGIQLAICSGYRSFERQCSIWNDKAAGKRPVYDAHNHLVDAADYTDAELVDLILTWSALPGCSRHHWGTDLDVFDAAAISKTELQLVNSEYLPQGPCHSLYLWLLEHSHSYGFYFPFQTGLSGVSAEPWHLSYYPQSQPLLTAFDIDTLQQIITNTNLALKSAVLCRLPQLVDEYVRRVAPPPQ
ncbi:peptidase M15 [Shewanella sp. NFH-SH190041]|uniref:M15 family metallopeptidase n=1 Tax=Shewanella sp. NFH-SH190041 TaxID=2950245 RepID=UPI0021C34234|nr:M15 family metallopeptidase [Shewanella sp. NFH-SH190041]BDM64782.1 peptidase M15 [Shewanella sp. NFH-SH190041]